MEVRARGQNKDSHYGSTGSGSGSSSGSGSGRGWLSSARRELRELGRATLRLFKGQASGLAYLFIPAVISLTWLAVCYLTTKNPSLTLEERLSQKYLRVS